ncbi:hypothetical protein ACA910_018247 [Epithemia clementina (nom. ined.)]
MKLGFALSPGGLLPPYHLGVLDGLSQSNNKRFTLLTEDTPLAGASAGAIASVCHACGLDSVAMIEATAELSASCYVNNGGRSNGLVQGLRTQIQKRLGENPDLYLERLRARPGLVGVAYLEMFPQFRPILQTKFDGVDDLTEAVCHSSTFPFFSTPYPCAIDTRGAVPRLVVDGFFAVPRERFGCPDLNLARATHASQDEEDDSQVDDQNKSLVDRTICVSCFPQERIGLTAVSDRDCISPAIHEGEEDQQFMDLLQIATRPLEFGFSTYLELYERGMRDAEGWVAREMANSWKMPTDETANVLE